MDAAPRGWPFPLAEVPGSNSPAQGSIGTRRNRAGKNPGIRSSRN